jgi:serine/threonine protein kinase
MTFNIDDKDFKDVKLFSSGSNVLVYTGIRNQEFIVVKMLKSESKSRRVAVEELNLEMQILAKVNHENIIRIIGAGEKPRKFIILEYLGGGTLDKLLDEMTIQEKSLQKQKTHGHLPLTLSFRWQTALPIAIQLATVLKYLHDDFHPKAAIIHRGR